MSRTFAVGKLDAEVLARLLGHFVSEHERVVLGPRLGEDVAVLDAGDRYLVAKSDPITFATDEIGWYAVNVNANDVATAGATPLFFLATVLLPEGQTDEALVEGIFAQLAAACRELGIVLVGGHTEITYDLSRPIVCGHLLGEVAKDGLVTTGGAQVGDAIVLTKGVAVEGTAILAREKAEELAGQVPADLLARAARFLHDPGISVVREAQIAVRTVPVHSMHDPTEGGLATGLHELADAAGVGVRVELAAVPILSECQQLCAPFDLNPLGLIASGSLLLTVAPADAEALCLALRREGITAAVIGEVTPSAAGRVLVVEGRERPLPRFDQDELAKVF